MAFFLSLSPGIPVVVTARSTDRLQSLVSHIRDDLKGVVHPVALDVTSPESITKFVEEAVRLLKNITILVNNAGIAIEKHALTYPLKDWDAVFDTNLKGAWLVAQGVAQHMVKNKIPGKIINITSITGTRVPKALPAYSASKAGLTHLTKVLASEWAKYNIRFVHRPVGGPLFCSRSPSSGFKWV